jgi:sn-glycerol 3-phosphate transport system permease protein
MMEKLSRLPLFITNIHAWILLLPSLIFLTLFTFYPILQTFYLSLFESNLGTPDPIFVGLQNFKQLMEDDLFWKVIKNTMWFTLGTVPTTMFLGLFMAIYMDKAIMGCSWMRTIFFYPAVIPMIAVANIWLFIYTPGYGLMNQFLGLFGIPDINWLGNTNNVMWAMILMMIWKQAGFFMIFYLAGLQNISKELYESAQIDGASSWFIFRKITFPLLMPTTLFVFIIAVTNAFKTVDHLVIMTQGGPNNASNLLLYYIYETAFRFWDLGMGATLTVVMLALLIILTSLKFIGLEKKIHYS